MMPKPPASMPIGPDDAGPQAEHGSRAGPVTARGEKQTLKRSHKATAVACAQETVHNPHHRNLRSPS